LDPRRLTTLWASTDCYRDSFTYILKELQIFGKYLFELKMHWENKVRNAELSPNGMDEYNGTGGQEKIQ
jgi:hypothetical protein